MAEEMRPPGQKMKPLEGCTISILGLGASGKAAAKLALDKGGNVYVSDLRTEPSRIWLTPNSSAILETLVLVPL